MKKQIIELIKNHFATKNIGKDLNTTLLAVVIILCSTALVISGHLSIAQIIAPEIIGLVLLFFKRSKKENNDINK